MSNAKNNNEYVNLTIYNGTQASIARPFSLEVKNNQSFFIDPNLGNQKVSPSLESYFFAKYLLNNFTENSDPVIRMLSVSANSLKT